MPRPAYARLEIIFQAGQIPGPCVTGTGQRFLSRGDAHKFAKNTHGIYAVRNRLWAQAGAENNGAMIGQINVEKFLL